MHLVRWLMASPLKGASKLYVGGDNTWGQLGDNTVLARSSPVLVSSNYWQSFALGTSHAVAIRNDGALFGWGNNDFGQVGDGFIYTNKSSPVQISTSSWTSVAASDANSYAIRKDGALFAWGSNATGQIGNNAVSVTTNYSWTQIHPGLRDMYGGALNFDYLLAIRSDNKLLTNSTDLIKSNFAYAAQAYDVNPSFSSIERTIPVADYGNENYNQAYISSGIYSQDSFGLGKRLASANNYALIKTDGSLFISGPNYFGELGNNTTVNSFSPVQIGTSSWSQICIEPGFAAAIRSDGALFTWGNNIYGQLGLGLYPGNDNKSSPVQVGTSSWSQVAINRKISNYLTTTVAAIRSDGALFMWGAPGQGDTFNPEYTGILGNNGARQNINISFTAVGSISLLDNFGNGYIIRDSLTGDGGVVGAQLYTYNFLQKFSGSWTQVEANYALKSDGTLYTWNVDTFAGSLIGPILTEGIVYNNRPRQIGSSSWSFISVNAAGIAAAIRSDGALFTWGSNGFGVLGDNTTVNKSSPVQIGTSSWTKVSAGPRHMLAIRSDSALFAWGYNTGGELGDGTTVSKSSPVQIGASSWVTVATRGQSADTTFNSYAIRTDGALFSWGRGNEGQLGDNTTVNKSSPVQIGTSSWTFIPNYYSRNTLYAIRTDGALFSWGSGEQGSLGDNTTVNKSSPVQIGTSSWTQVRSMLTNVVFGTLINGSLYRWGNAPSTLFEPGTTNASSPVQIGNTDSRFNSPVQIGTSSWSQVTLNTWYAHAIRSDGALFAWGKNIIGALGDGTTVNKSSPVQIGTSSWSQVWNTTGGWSHAIRSDKALFAWGTNSSGQLGDNTVVSKSSPVQIGTSSWTQVKSRTNTFALRSDGALFAWGTISIPESAIIVQRSSPVQINTAFQASSPVQIGTSSWSLVTAGKSYASAIRSDRALFAWGVNTNYNLGDGTSLNRSSPVQIGTSSWTLVNAGTDFTLGIASNSVLYGWGNNDNFATGVSDFVNPIMGAGFSHGAIVTRKGRLYTWGLNNFGQLGDGTTINKSSPIQIGTSSWSLVSGGYEHTLALNSIGQLYAWGRNTFGQLGDNTSINKSSPVQIGTSSWSQIKAGISHSMAVRVDGALFTWGSNSFGQLGRGIDTLTLNVSSPVQVGTSSWTFATTNRETAYAIRSDGALFGWGKNDVGQIGNNAVNISGVMSWTQVTTGGSSQSGRGIRSDGGLFTWGTNGSGQLGDGTITDRLSPVQIGTSSWTQIAGLLNSTAAIRFDGALFTWGNGSFGQLGSNATTNRSSPVQVGTSSWTQIKAGNNNYIALRSDGGLFTFGVNSAGQLGDGTTTDRSSPVQIGTSSWTAIGAGSFHTLAIRNDGALYAWGENTGGQLGDGTYPYVNRSSPVQISTSSWTQVTGGNYHTVALRNDSGLFAWGWNEFGQLGTNSILYGSERVFSWTQISAKQDVSAAIRSDGKLFTWGLGSNGGLGTNSTVNNTYSPVQVGNSSWTQVAAGAFSCAAIRTDGALFTWGWNNYGQLGNNTVVNTSSPVQIGTSSWIQVTSGLRAKFAIRTDGALYGWGGSDVTYTFGAEPLGDGTTISRSSPVLIGGTSSWTQVNAGWYTYSAIRTDGALFMWGNSNQGGTGKGDPFGSDIYSWTQVRTSGSHTVALNSLGQLWAWGVNSSGQLGDGTTVNKSFPVQIGTSSWTVVSVTPGTSNSAAIRSDGRLFVWGSNTAGVLGDNTTINKSSPVQIDAVNSWSQVSLGSGALSMACLAIRTSGALYGWGYQGVVGDNTTVTRSSPVQIGTSSWTQISLGVATAAAIRTDGALFTWGFNNYGMLGDGTTINRSSPVQIGTSSWSQVSMGADFNTGAIRSDGALFMWGLNEFGAVADGTNESRSSPVQIGTSSWAQLSLGLDCYAAKRTDGAIFAWGFFYQGGDVTFYGTDLLGTGATSYINKRQSWSQVVGTDSYYGIRADGKLYCWGLNAPGGPFAPIPTRGDIYYPYPIIGNSSWTQVATSLFSSNSRNAFAIRADGGLFAWGRNVEGQLGNNTTVSVSDSIIQIGTSSWIQVATTGSSTAAIRSDGGLFTWGSSTNGVLGDGTTVSKSSPVQIGTSSWTQVKAYADHVLAIRSDGALFAWGQNAVGQLGDGTTVAKSSPVQIGSSSWIFVEAGSSAIRSDGALFTWGNNSVGQLGDNTTVSKSSPVQIGTSSWILTTARRAAAPASTNNTAMQAIRSDGAMFSWGSQRRDPGVGGALTFAVGDGTTVNRSSPVQIGIGNSWIFVTKNRGEVSAASIAIRSDGLVYVWGVTSTASSSYTGMQFGPYNLVSSSGPSAYGNSGAGNFIITPTPVGDVMFYDSPVQVGTDSWTQITVGSKSSLFGIRNNKMYAWGANESGQLGNNSTIPTSSPVQIGFYSTLLSPQRIGTASWTQINLGYFTGAGITTNGRLHTWGQNASGQIGDSTTLNQFTIQERGVYSWTQISTNSAGEFGDSNYCNYAAIRSDGALFTWGNGATGALGNGTTLNSSSPVQIGTSSWVQVSINTNGGIAIRANDYTVWVWGSGDRGRLGDNTIVNKSSPVQIGSIRAEKVLADTYSTYIIEKWTNLLIAWGYNIWGQLGDDTTVNRSSPVVIGSSRWSQIASGYATAAIRSDGALFTWGSTEYGQLADGSSAYRSSPVQVGTSSWTQIKTSGRHHLAIRSDGALFTWGNYFNGQGGTNADINSPQDLTKSWTAISVNNYSGAGIRSDGLLFVWGSNIFGLTLSAQSTLDAIYSPVQVGTSSWTQVKLGDQHGIALRADGAIFTWGSNIAGQLGNNTAPIAASARSSPVQIGTSSWTQIEAGGYNCFAIRTDGALFAWGDNQTGQLGINASGVLGRRSSPVQIGTSSWSQVRSGVGDANNSLDYVLAIRSGGSLFAWGSNAEGYLGDNSAISRSSPVQIGTSSWTQVAVMNYTAAAIRSDGALFTWGSGFPGGLGDGTTANRSSPVQIGTSSWTQVSCFELIRSDGALFTWGFNNAGSIGDNTTISKSSIVQIGTSSWTILGRNYVFADFGATRAAIRTDGALFTWGAGQNGNTSYYARPVNEGEGISSPVQIGLISTYTSPVQVGNSSWTQIATTLFSSAAIRTDGALFTWGNNFYGQLGSNTTTNRSSPVQVGTESWSQLGTIGSSLFSIQKDSTLYVWGANGGSNNRGVLGDSSTTNKSSPVQLGYTGSWTNVAMDISIGGATRSDGALFMWGNNSSGNFGNNSTVSASSPVQIGSDSWTVVQVSDNIAKVSYFLRSNNLLYGTGNRVPDSTNPLSTTVFRSSPVLIGLVRSVSSPVQIGTSSWSQVGTIINNTSVAIRTGGSLFTWGFNSSGELADGTTINKSSPVQIGSSSWIFASGNAGILSNNTLYTWSGPNSLGDNSANPRSSPVQIGSYPLAKSPIQIGTSSWSTISAGGTHAVAIRSNGSLFGWGLATSGQVGDGTLVSKSSPVQIGSSSWTAITAGNLTSYGITSAKLLFAWGGGANGTFGDGTTTNKPSPVQISAAAWNDVSSDDTTAYATRYDGKLFAWGLNASGQIGTLTTANTSSPVQVGTFFGAPTLVDSGSWSFVSAGFDNSIGIDSNKKAYIWGNDRTSAYTWTYLVYGAAIRSDGALFRWGNNSSGQLGDGTTVNKSSPVQIGTSSWTQVVYDTNCTNAIRVDGALFTWGSNSNGLLGDGTTVNKSSPVQIGTSSWTQVCVYGTGRAIRSDGRLFAWGANNNGQLGDNTIVFRSSPVQIGTSSWTQVSYSSGLLTYAIRSDGALFGTGYAVYGLGDGTTIPRSSPVQVGTSSWTQVRPSLVNGSTFAIRSDGALFAWGDNASGQLGLNSSTPSESSMVQIGTSSWTQIAFNANLAAAPVLATRADGALFAWAFPGSPITPTNYPFSTFLSSPVQISSLSGVSWTQVYAAAETTLFAGAYWFALTQSTGKKYLFNNVYRSYRFPGDEYPNLVPAEFTDIVSYSSPVQIGVGGTWIKGSAGAGQNYLINNANVLYSWGSRLLSAGVIQTDSTITPVVADIDSAVANKAFNVTRGYIEK